MHVSITKLTTSNERGQIYRDLVGWLKSMKLRSAKFLRRKGRQMNMGEYERGAALRMFCLDVKDITGVV